VQEGLGDELVVLQTLAALHCLDLVSQGSLQTQTSYSF
jgi:hypothetical protein